MELRYLMLLSMLLLRLTCGNTKVIALNINAFDFANNVMVKPVSQWFAKGRVTAN